MDKIIVAQKPLIIKKATSQDLNPYFILELYY